MRVKYYVFSLFLCMNIIWVVSAGATSVQPFSQYGQIQNVQNYSSNPFWNPNSPYNQRFPTPVYVTGPAVTTADCLQVVDALIASYCVVNDNCKNMRLIDVRPVMMLQLSQLPGHNYATACNGYIDTQFQKYQDSHTGQIVPVMGAVSFPVATVANPNADDSNEFKMENPYKTSVPDWAREMQERSQELKALQEENEKMREAAEAAEAAAAQAKAASGI